MIIVGSESEDVRNLKTIPVFLKMAADPSQDVAASGCFKQMRDVDEIHTNTVLCNGSLVNPNQCVHTFAAPRRLLTILRFIAQRS